MRVKGKFIHRIRIEKSKKGVRVILQGRGPKGTVYPLAWKQFAQGRPGDLVAEFLETAVDTVPPE